MIASLGLAIAGTCVGACVGSFVATAALRWARGETAMSGRSRCDFCRTPLGFAATTPLVSWAVKRGACSVCGGRISSLHPIGELVGAFLGLAVAMVSSSGRQAGCLATLCFALLGAALIDSETLTLPDALTFAVAISGVALSALRSVGTVEQGLIAAVLAFVLLEAVRRAFLVSQGKPGLGFGDVKLTAALALWLGILTPWAVALAAIFGLTAFATLRPADGRLPFGPWLALGGGLVGLAREAGIWPAMV